MSKLTLIALFLTLTVTAQSQSCSKQDEVEEIFSIKSKVELLFFFRKNSSRKARDHFYENVLNQPVSGGYWPRDGVKATFGIDRNGYEGFGFKFSKDATEQQRKDIKRLLLESPIVYRVYENVVPNDITDLTNGDNTNRGKETAQ